MSTEGENLPITFITEHCYQLPIFLTKVHIYWSSFLLWYQVSYICISCMGKNFSLRALKFDMAVAAAMNFFIPNVEEFFETILSLFNQSNACLELLLDGEQAEFLSRRLEQSEQTLRFVYQRLTETCPRQETIRHDVEQLINALRQLFPLVSVRHWYKTHKVCSHCSNLVDRNSAWSPSHNSKHALLWLNNYKIVLKNSSTLGMKKFIAMLNFKARSFQTARALLTGSSPGLLDLWNCTNLTYIFYSFDEPWFWGQGKSCIPCKYNKLDIKVRNLITNMYGFR